jgi:opacity protein-like surface antigen
MSNMPIKPDHFRAAIALLAFPACACVHADEWKNAITPYLWMSGMSGKTVIGTPLGPVEADVDLNFGDILSNLDMGAMVSYEGGINRWVVLGDLIYMKLGASDTRSSGAVSLRASANVEQTMAEADMGYYITDSIALFAGARFNDIDTSIHTERTGPGAGSSQAANTSQSWVDPVVGLLGKWPLTEKLEWDLRADIGGFDVGSKFAWQAMVALRWKLRPNWDVVASYRYMEVDYENDGPDGLLKYDMINTGPGIGVTFRF